MKATDNDVTLANIRAEAARRRVRQADLAEALGLSQQAMSRRLTGVVPFTIDELRAIAGRLKVSVTQLVEGTGTDTPSAAMA